MITHQFFFQCSRSLWFNLGKRQFEQNVKKKNEFLFMFWRDPLWICTVSSQFGQQQPPPEKKLKHWISRLYNFLINYANDTSSHPINVALIISAVLTQDRLQSVSTSPGHMGRLHRTAIRWQESKENKKRKNKFFILKHSIIQVQYSTLLQARKGYWLIKG